MAGREFVLSTGRLVTFRYKPAAGEDEGAVEIVSEETALTEDELEEARAELDRIMLTAVFGEPAT